MSTQQSNYVSHILPTEEFIRDWRTTLASEKEKVYESYLRFYFAVKEQHSSDEVLPTTFGFYINTPYADNSNKSGVIFHRRDIGNVVLSPSQERGVYREVSEMLSDHGLDFEYQRKVRTLVEPLPNPNTFIFTFVHDTPHRIMDESHEPGCLLEDFAPSYIPGHEFFKLCDRHDNKVFAIP